MPSRFDPPLDPEEPTPDEKRIDTTKRYDVYCSQWQHRIILFRNVRFKRVARLHGRHFPDYTELEQENGQTVFVSSTSIIMFCEPGTTPCFEKVQV
jgi:hypothetical protein